MIPMIHNRDAFIPPKPYNSWILNEQLHVLWEAPVARSYMMVI
jgi:hypothetical protein